MGREGHQGRTTVREPKDTQQGRDAAVRSWGPRGPAACLPLKMRARVSKGRDQGREGRQRLCSHRGRRKQPEAG